jgi:hypothetical protein
MADFTDRDAFRKAISEVGLTINADGLQLIELLVCLQTGVDTYEQILQTPDLDERARKQSTDALAVLRPVLASLNTTMGVVTLVAEARADGEYSDETREALNSGPAMPEGFTLQ